MTQPTKRRCFHYEIGGPEGGPGGFCGKTVDELLCGLGYSRRLIIALKKEDDGLRLIPGSGPAKPGLVSRPADGASCPADGASCLSDGAPRPGIAASRRATTADCLHTGDTLIVTLPREAAPEKLVRTPMDLDVAYEDSDLLVAKKDAGVSIHPSQGHFADSLASGIAWYAAQKGESYPIRVINRLDCGTSGLLIVAKHALSACILADMVAARRIRRTYLAVVQGNLATCGGGKPGVSKANDGWGTVNAPIGRVTGSAMERQVDFEHGAEAVTHYRVLSYDPAKDVSLAELALETGRTHQIRVHMKYLGCPLPGDYLYNPDYHLIGRPSLHSWKLAFTHPITKEPMAFTAPVPDDMRSIFP